MTGEMRFYAYQPGQLDRIYAGALSDLAPGFGYIEFVALAGSSTGLLCYQYYDEFESGAAYCLYPDGQGGYSPSEAGAASSWFSYSDTEVVARYYNYANPPYSIVTRPGIDDAREDLLGAIQVQPIKGAITVTGSQTGETGTVLNLAYTYDAGGQITGILERRNGGPELDRQYRYDTAGRLIEESRGAQTTTWQYDANGNRTHENGSLIATYDDRDRLLSYRDSTFTYNALGQPKQIATPQGNWGFSHDVYGNLLSVSTPAGDSIDYLVDPLHRRIGRKVNGATTHLWVYKDQINPVAELYPSGAVKYHFTYAEQGHVPSLMRHYDEAGNLLHEYRYITDHLGSVLMLIDIESNAIVQEIEYDAWGNVLSDSNPGFQPFYYAGGVYDQTTKLTKFGYRDYQAETGRFVQSDPIGLSGGINTHAYVESNPLGDIDPYGLRGGQMGRRQLYSPSDYSSIQRFICDHGSLSLSINIGMGLGVNGKLVITPKGISGYVGGGVGVGLGASATVNAVVSNHVGAGFATSGSINGGAGFGGSANVTAGTSGVSASAGIGVGLGFGGSATLGVRGTIKEFSFDCDDECKK